MVQSHGECIYQYIKIVKLGELLQSKKYLILYFSDIEVKLKTRQLSNKELAQSIKGNLPGKELSLLRLGSL